MILDFTNAARIQKVIYHTLPLIWILWGNYQQDKDYMRLQVARRLQMSQEEEEPLPVVMGEIAMIAYSVQNVATHVNMSMLSWPLPGILTCFSNVD